VRRATWRGPVAAPSRRGLPLQPLCAASTI
jgi:hypothetical protein